jgi:DNA-binding transcriptional ArsR family regulator
MFFLFFRKEEREEKMKIIANEYFNVLLNLEKTSEYVRERQNIKHNLLDGIANVLGRSYRKAKKVAAVIDEIAYKATDRGFSFNGRQTLAEKVGVSLPTVDRAVKLLKESGLVYVGYRENPRSNSGKTPVIIFKEHANYKRIASILKLHDEVVDKVENLESPRETSSTDAKIVSTNTYLKQEKYNIYPSFEKIVDYVCLKVSDALNKNGKGISFLSSYIDKTIATEDKKAYYKAQKAYHNRLETQRQRMKSNINAPGLDWLANGQASL